MSRNGGGGDCDCPKNFQYEPQHGIRRQLYFTGCSRIAQYGQNGKAARPDQPGRCVSQNRGLIRDASGQLQPRQYRKAGAKIYRATDEEISELKKAMSVVWQEVEKIAGPEGKPFAEVILPLQK